MVSIAANATFNRNTLLADMFQALESCDLEYPSDDYVRASYMVWFAMRQQAVRTGERMSGDNDKPGWSVEGMSPGDVIRLLWPQLADRYVSPAASAVRDIMKRNNNGFYLVNGRRFVTSVWWVADEWTAPTGPRAKAHPNNTAVRRDQKRAQRSVDLANGMIESVIQQTDADVAEESPSKISEDDGTPTADAVPTSDEPSQPASEASTGDVAAEVDGTEVRAAPEWVSFGVQSHPLNRSIIDLLKQANDVVAENLKLRKENDELRAKLDVITSVLR